MEREQIVKEILNQLSPTTISLFLTGSTVDGTAQEDSDIDFIAIVSDPSLKVRVQKIVRRSETR